MTLGPRVFKTGLSITIALYVCAYFELEPAIFAAVAAIFTVQPSIYKSWKQVLDQLQTNTLGAVIALAASSLFGNEPVAIGIVAILVILICLRMKMESTIGLTLVTVLVIMSAPGDEDIWFTVNRFILILIGMGSAFIVNITILRPKHQGMFIEKARATFDRMSLLLRTAISDEMTEKEFRKQADELSKEIEQLDDLFGMFDEERRKLAKLRHIDVRQLVVFKQMLQSLHKGADILQIVEEHYIQGGHKEEVNLVFDHYIEQLTKVHEHILLSYEGKMKVGVLSHTVHLNENVAFMQRIMTFYEDEPERKLGLVLVGSAIYEYGFQLQRLERLIEREANKRVMH